MKTTLTQPVGIVLALVVALAAAAAAVVAGPLVVAGYATVALAMAAGAVLGRFVRGDGDAKRVGIIAIISLLAVVPVSVGAPILAMKAGLVFSASAVAVLGLVVTYMLGVLGAFGTRQMGELL